MDEAELEALIAQFIGDWRYIDDGVNAEFEQDLRALIASCRRCPLPMQTDEVPITPPKHKRKYLL